MKTLFNLLLMTGLYADPMQDAATPTTEQQPAAQPTPLVDSSPSNTQADDSMDQIVYVECDECDPYSSFILNEFKMGYFRFENKELRHVYDKGVLDLQLTSSFRFWKPLYAYFAIEYINAEGRTIGGHKKTKIRIVPLSLGVQYIQPVTCDFKYYLTIGPRYFFFHQHNYSSGLQPIVNKNGCGGFINTGFMYYLSNHIIIDFFGEYSYKMMHFKSHRTLVEGNSFQVGGLTLGAGLGYFW
jgi:hypothetical protein